jgi:hypothetical protein
MKNLSLEAKESAGSLELAIPRSLLMERAIHDGVIHGNAVPLVHMRWGVTVMHDGYFTLPLIPSHQGRGDYIMIRYPAVLLQGASIPALF